MLSHCLHMRQNRDVLDVLDVLLVMQRRTVWSSVRADHCCSVALLSSVYSEGNWSQQESCGLNSSST